MDQEKVYLSFPKKTKKAWKQAILHVYEGIPLQIGWPGRVVF
jgi:hypothetical protein